jgi:hypothetical protein
MLVKELKDKDFDNRMELGPESNEYYEYIKCDRCGKIQSDLPDMYTDEGGFFARLAGKSLTETPSGW